MRWLLAFGFVVLSSLPSAAAAPDGAPTQKRPVVPWRPHAWHPPTSATTGAAGIRVEPEDGAAPTGMDDLAAQIAARRQALARVPVRVHPDGSRHAVLGDLARAYTVARINADGTLSQECVHTAAQAKALMNAAEQQARETTRTPSTPAPAAKKER